jgi:cytochrome c oxidase cbb3-type subunit 3
VIFALVYLVLYPGSGIYAGKLGWTSQSQHAAEVRAAENLQNARFARYDKLDLRTLSHDAEAMTTAHNIFGNTCAGCHGSDARGAVGFPNLTDNDWLHGGSPEDILETVTNGRIGIMPPFGPAVGERGVDELVAYVQSLSGQSASPGLASAGAVRFQSFCIACHGPEGKGNPLIGAPNLTDNIWLYGSSPAVIAQTITNGRQNAMPPHLPILGAQRVRLMAAYVLSLSEQSATAAE